MKIRILMASAAVLALVACGRGEDDGANASADQNIVLANESVLDNTVVAGNAAVPANGQEYARMAAASDMYEIESSRLASDKAQSQQVKQFAQMLITDHQKSTDQLKTAAQQAQPAITLTPAMDPEQEANMQALQAASGADFERVYLQQQVQAHQKALAMVQGYAQNGDVPGLKQHAQTVSGPIQQHLQQAQQLSTQPAQ